MQGTSLVKYHTPILVSITNAKGKKGQKKPAVEKATSQTEDILNSILPPRLDKTFLFAKGFFAYL